MLQVQMLVDHRLTDRVTPSAEAILAAAVYGAQTFLNDPDWSSLLVPWLRRLGEATGASQVRVFKNDEDSAGADLRSSFFAEWRAPGVQGSPREMLQHVSFREVGCGRWVDILAVGEVVAGNTDELPASERPILRQETVQSVAVVPIFSGKQWWGFFGFGDCKQPRTWSAEEIQALKAAAGILGGAVGRQEMEERIATAKVQEQLAAEIGQVLTASAKNLEDILEVCCARIAHHLQADMVRVWTIDDERQRLRGSSVGWPAMTGFAAGSADLDQCAVGRIARTVQPEIWQDNVPELWPGSQAIFRAQGLTAGAGHPLVFDGKLVGVVVLLLRQPSATNVFESLFSITDELALAIERSHAQSALHVSEDRYRRLVDVTMEGICIHNGRQLFDCNPSLAAMVGLDVPSIIGRNPMDFIHPDSKAEVQRNLASNYTKAYQLKMLRADGSVFPAEIKGYSYDLNGVNMRVSSIRDITERKAAERAAEQLREEQHARAVAEANRANAEFLAAASRILASSFDTSTTLNQLAHLSVRFLADCCVVTVMQGEEQHLAAAVHADASRQQMLEAALSDWRNNPMCKHPLPTRLRTGEPFIENWLHETDPAIARLGWRTVMSVPITSGGDLVGSMLFACSDSDKVYNLEQLSVAQELGRRAAVALQSARSYREAQAATLARDEMLAVVAHDLRNPLNTIFMASTMVLDMTTDAPQSLGRREFEIIKRSSEHMNRLIQDLLDATRLQSGQLALEMMSTPPAAIVEEAIELLNPIALHAGISFTADVSTDAPRLNVDRMRVLQVLSNLVGNALKFTPRGGNVSLVVEPDPTGACFSVRDTGPGIAPEEVPHIFGRFWQARRTDRRGLGLGLAIAKGIVEAHGGRIWVESVPGEGSTFLFTMPQQSA